MKRTAQPHNEEIHFSQMATKPAEMRRKRLETPHVFPEQKNRNV